MKLRIYIIETEQKHTVFDKNFLTKNRLCGIITLTLKELKLWKELKLLY